jgi:streptomycin 6-kinase
VADSVPAPSCNASDTRHAASPSHIDVPDRVRVRALAHGPAGARWLRELPDIVDDVARRWGITVGSTLTGGSAAYVAEATTRDGDPAVLKVALPAAIEGAGMFDRSVTTYQLAGGHGCAALLRHDDDLSALLLERLGRSLDELRLPVAEQIEVICRTVQQVWRPVPADVALTTGADKAGQLAAYILFAWDALGRPCEERTTALALKYATERAAAFDLSTAVLVHGDAHSWNTLEARHGAFKLVDPEGLISEPAHDLAIPMRELNEELLAGDAATLGHTRARRLSDVTGVEIEPIWQWGFIERVSTGLFLMQLDPSTGHDFLAIADEWSARPLR